MENIKSNIEEFFNGGNTTTAKLGRITGKIINTATKCCVLALFVFVFVCAAQIGQYFVSAKEVRAHAIAKWVVENPDNKALADKFTSECVVGKKIKHIDMETKIIGVYECGTALGADSLVSSVKKADLILNTPAWPLSLLL